MGLEALNAAGRNARGNARAIAGVFFCVLALLLQGCAGLWPQTAELREGLPQGLPLRTELAQVPFFPQDEYQCGPAALATVLASAGAKVTPDWLMSGGLTLSPPVVMVGAKMADPPIWNASFWNASLWNAPSAPPMSGGETVCAAMTVNAKTTPD